MTEEQQKNVEELAVEGFNSWAKRLICGPFMEELIKGQTEVIFLAMPSLKDEDRSAVKRVVREKLKEEMVKIFTELGK